MDFFQNIKQIGIFMICAQAILHFKPSEKYEKYLKLLISVMILAQLLSPVMQIISGNNCEDFQSRIEDIQAEINQKMEQLEIENAINEENILRETEKEIKIRINNIAIKYELSVHYIQAQPAEFGGKLIVYVQEMKKMQDVDIHIDSISTDFEDSIIESGIQLETEKNKKLQVLRKEISRDLNVPEDGIEVLWYES